VTTTEALHSKRIIIGTRGSALALTQTHWVQKQLSRHFPGMEISVQIIKTSADKDTTTSLRASSGIGVFVKELEYALLRNEIDLAVHSMKDVPTLLTEGLCISAIPEREDVCDALIAKKPVTLQELPEGCRIGTGSFRRQSQLLAVRPDLAIIDIRGNVETRIRKMEEGLCDVIILACAGLRRLGLQGRISSVLDLKNMLPAPGQGALAVETRISDSRTNEIVAVLNHEPTANAVMAERAFLLLLGGGCNVPIAVFARPDNDFLEIDGLVASPDGRKLIKDTVRDRVENSSKAIVRLAELILSKGGKAILEEFRHHG
jgi:hydroxymethylbilane synthase